MDRSRKIYAAKCAVILSAIPALIYAHDSGPDPNVNGAPPSNRSCNQASCHVGTAVNGGGGKVEVTFSDGSTYTPGQKQNITVKVSDPTARVYGFQMSAQTAAGDNQAGSFSTPDPKIFVICLDGSEPAATGCRANPPLQYIEHNQPSTTGLFNVQWTPPATAVGDIKFYVAGNGANGDGFQTGDHIYTSAYTLTAATSSGPKPTISQGGIADAFTFNAGTASSTWTAIFGTNLSATTRTWGDADFKGTPPKLPTDLDGVGVTINGKPAYVYFISPGQINVLAPADDQTGNVQVVVTSPKGNSDPVTVTKATVQPAFYAPYAQNGKLFATVVSPAGPLLGKVGVDPRVTRAVKPGETILIYGTGFGATNPVAPPELFVVGAPRLVTQPVIRFGDVQAAIQFGGIIGSGLYQFNVTVPNVPDGDVPLVAQIGGTSSLSNVYISVQK